MKPVELRPPLVVGVIGGISSGKSAVAEAFEGLGFVRIDADAEAREAVDRVEVRAAILQRFGSRALQTDGTLDRAGLAAVVFDDAEARADLEAITHPTILAAIERRLSEALAAGRSAVLDAPLLLEGGLVAHCDAVVFVEVPEPERVLRASERGWDSAELRRREAAQLPLAVKKARATATIRNTGSLDRIQRRVAQLLRTWARRRPCLDRGR